MDMRDILVIDGVYKLELESLILMQIRSEKLNVSPSDILEVIQLKLEYYIERIMNGDIKALMPDYNFSGYQIDVHFFKEVPADVDKYLREIADEVRDKDISMTVSVAFE